MPKQKQVIGIIYDRIGKGKDPSYGNYLGWVSLALAKRFRWGSVVSIDFDLFVIDEYIL